MSELVKKPLFQFSKYDRTYNNAIDLAAECIGYYRSMNMPLKTIYFNQAYYDLFRKGMEVLMKRDLLPEETFQFDGVNIECRRAQFDKMRYDFYPLNIKA